MDLNTILRALEQERCVLLLGSEMPFITSSLNRQQLIWEKLTENGFSDLIQFKDDDFYYFPNPNQRLKACAKLIEMYENFPVNDLYKNVAQIPFSLIISLSPDVLLKKTYTELFGEKSFDFEYYMYGEANKDVKFLPSKKRPVLYNLLGDITQNEDSVILTFDDLFNFFASIFGQYQLPNNIKLKLQDATCFIFLGFKFHAWYYKLLLRILGIDAKKLTYCYPDENFGLDKNDNVLLFFDKYFNMDFSPFNVKKFIDELYELCDQKKMLRTKSSIVVFDDAVIRSLIQQDKLSEAFKTIENYLKEIQSNDKQAKEQLNVLDIIHNSYNSYKLEKLKGIDKEIEIKKSKIIDDLLSLIDTINS
jgi:hypothetical protein